jgi:hypothetical protein
MPKYSQLFYTLLMATLFATQNANGAESANKQFKQLLAQQSKQLQAQQRVLDAQSRQLNELQSRLDTLSGKKVSSVPARSPQKLDQTAKSEVSRPSALARGSQSVENPQRQMASAGPKLRAMPKETKAPEIPRISADVGGVLTPQGRFVLEPLLQYSYSKSQRVALAGYTVGSALLIGVADVRDVRRETETVALTGRYGVTNRLELEAKFPYTRRDDTSQTRSIVNPNATDKFFNADGIDIGDIEVAGHYQINDGKDGWPFLIGNLRVKTDTGTSPFEVPIDADFFLPTKLNTGTGFWSIQPSLTAIFPSDPAVFYANVSYLWDMERDIPNRVYQFRVRDKDGNKNFINIKSGGKTDPGDAIGFSFGTSLAFNEKASFSLGYSHSIYFKTKQNGQSIEGSDFDVGQFTFGLNYVFAKKTSANLAVAIGATRDAPDVQMTLRVPIGFDVF